MRMVSKYHKSRRERASQWSIVVVIYKLCEGVKRTIPEMFSICSFCYSGRKRGRDREARFFLRFRFRFCKLASLWIHSLLGVRIWPGNVWDTAGCSGGSGTMYLQGQYFYAFALFVKVKQIIEMKTDSIKSCGRDEIRRSSRAFSIYF